MSVAPYKVTPQRSLVARSLMLMVGRWSYDVSNGVRCFTSPRPTTLCGWI
jgi:hypothetical protein